MSFIEKIRSKSHAEKVRIIWLVCGITAAMLILLWVATSRIGKTAPTDKSLFQTFGRGVKDMKNNFNK